MHLPNFNPTKKSRVAAISRSVADDDDERWYEEPDTDAPSFESTQDKQGSEGELRESGYGSATGGRCGWLKRNKWKALAVGALVLVIVIVLVAVLVPRGGGGDEGGEPTQVSSTGNATGSTPTMAPAANETTTKPSTPTAAPNETQSSGLAPSVLFSPAGSPAQAPFVFEQEENGLVWNQFGEVSPEGNAKSLSSAVSGDGETVALMSRTPGNSAISVSVYRFNGEWRKLGESILGDGDISIIGTGQSLALSQRGNILVIGFFNAACETGENCGRVQVHTFREGEWQQIGSDVVGDEPNVMLGLSVAISGNGKTIAAGAPYGNGADGLIHIGKVKVLRFVKSDWKLLGDKDLQGDEMRDQLGSSVSLNEDGTIVACGAPQGGMPGKTGYVKVAMYDDTTESFSEMGSYISGREGLDQMGLALALSYNGTEIAVSAFNTVGSGLVCVFMFEGVAWIKIGDDIDSPVGRGDLFAYSVDMDAIGGRIAVGAPDSRGMTGAVYLFQLEKRGWEQRGEIMESSFDGAQLGRSVSVSASGLIVSGGGESGAQIYYDSGIEGPLPEVEGFTQVGDILGERAKGTTFIASTLSGDGTTAAVASRNKANEVTVTVYSYDPTTGWTQLGEDIKGTGTIDAVGKSLALSENGDKIVIGFYNEGCDAGANCGHVRVYSYEGNAWQQLGQDIVGNVAEGFLGWSVACSSEGLIVACGAPIAHGANSTDHPGKVRVFVFEDSQWTQVGRDLEGDSEWDHLGSSLAISRDGTFLATGAVQGLEGNLGYVKMFQYDRATNSFIQFGENLRGDNRTDKFGDSVSLTDDGLTLAVGADKSGAKNDVEARSSGLSFGLVTVFRNSNSTWTQVGNVLESGRTGDMFGYSVAIDALGETVVIGAPEDYRNEGSVHVFSYDKKNDLWIQHGDEIYPIDIQGSGKSQFGRSVAVSKSGEFVSAGSYLGSQVYELDFTAPKAGAGNAPFASPFAPFAPWGQPFASPGSSNEVEFASPNASPVGFPGSPIASPSESVQGLTQLGDIVGIDEEALSISSTLSGDGKTTAVASKIDPDVVRIRVFQLDPTGAWSKIGGDIVGTGELDGTGKSLALSENGDTVVIGFFDEECDAGENCGRVRAYSFASGDWQQLGTDIIGEKTYGFMGMSIAASTDARTIAVGAAISHGETLSHAGKVRVFRFEDATWTQLGKDLEGEKEWDNFGASVSLSGDASTLACGAVQGVAGSLGYAKVFQYAEGSNAFVQRGANIVGDERTDRFGESISLSEDGFRVAVGGTKGSDAEEGDKNAEPTFGLVQVFRYGQAGWAKEGNDIVSGTTGDLFGFSVAMNAEGSRLIVGAPECGSSLAGCALTFDNIEGVWTFDTKIEAAVNGVPPNQLGRSVAISTSGDTVAAGGRAGMQVYKASGERGGDVAGSSPQAAPAFAPFSETTVEGAPIGSSGALPVPSAFSPVAPFAPSSPTTTSVVGAPVGTPPPVEEPKQDATSNGQGETSQIAPFAPAGAPFASPASAPVAEESGNAQPAEEPKQDTGTTSNEGTVASPVAGIGPAEAPFASPASAPVAEESGNAQPVEEPKQDTGTTSNEGTVASPVSGIAPAEAPFASPASAPVDEESGNAQPVEEPKQDTGTTSNEGTVASPVSGIAPAEAPFASPASAPVAEESGTAQPTEEPKQDTETTSNEPSVQDHSPEASPILLMPFAPAGPPFGSPEDSGTPAPVLPGVTKEKDPPSAQMPFAPASPMEAPVGQPAGLPTTDGSEEARTPTGNGADFEPSSGAALEAPSVIFGPSSPIAAPGLSPSIETNGSPTTEGSDEIPTSTGNDADFEPTSAAALDVPSAAAVPSSPIPAPALSPEAETGGSPTTNVSGEISTPTGNDADFEPTSAAALDVPSAAAVPSSPIPAPALSPEAETGGSPTTNVSGEISTPTGNDADFEPTSAAALDVPSAATELMSPEVAPVQAEPVASSPTTEVAEETPTVVANARDIEPTSIDAPVGEFEPSSPQMAPFAPNAQPASLPTSEVMESGTPAPVVTEPQTSEPTESPTSVPLTEGQPSSMPTSQPVEQEQSSSQPAAPDTTVPMSLDAEPTSQPIVQETAVPVSIDVQPSSQPIAQEQPSSQPVVQEQPTSQPIAQDETEVPVSLDTQPTSQPIVQEESMPFAPNAQPANSLPAAEIEEESTVAQPAQSPSMGAAPDAFPFAPFAPTSDE